MKILIILALFIASCSNKADQAKVYRDSANYYSVRLAAITDAGGNSIEHKTEYVLCSTMRKYYIDKMKETEKPR